MNPQIENERSYFWNTSNLRIGGQTIVPLPYWLLLLLAVAMLPIYGCAEDRWLTKEQGAEFRKTCEKTGCPVIPDPVWDEIKRRLGLTET